MKFTKLLLATLAVAGLTACSDDNDQNYSTVTYSFEFTDTSSLYNEDAIGLMFTTKRQLHAMCHRHLLCRTPQTQFGNHGPVSAPHKQTKLPTYLPKAF
jgi:hypothetical protein